MGDFLVGFSLIGPLGLVLIMYLEATHETPKQRSEDVTKARRHRAWLASHPPKETTENLLKRKFELSGGW